MKGKKMGLFDIFTLKRDGEKVISKEFFLGILKTAREEIVQAAKKNIPGEEKKKQVDMAVIAYIYAKVNNLNIRNKAVLWAVDEIVDMIPSVTQLIYDFLKEKIENL